MNDYDSTGSTGDVAVLINKDGCDSTYTPQALLMLVEELIKKNVELGTFKPGQVSAKLVGDQVVLTDHSRSREFKLQQMVSERLMETFKLEEPIADEKNPNPFNRAARRGNKHMDPAVVRGWVRNKKHWKDGK